MTAIEIVNAIKPMLRFSFSTVSGSLSGTHRHVGLLMAILSVSGCTSSDPGPVPPPVMTAETAEEQAQERSSEQPVVRLPGERQAFDGLAFVVPEGWKETPLSDAQKGFVTAKFTMPAAGPDVGLTLSRSGGGVEANLDRWRGQVTATAPEVTETISVAGVESTLIDLTGSLAGGFGKEPITNGRMLGIIVPLPDQGYFLKLTGPADQVELVADDFRAFAKSAALE
ncbi:MAG: hypothetical protein R3C59_29780 [Planctomycetaceae bacterium]